MAEAMNYLDPKTLASIASLDLRARMIVEGLMTGMHRSPYQGFSVEFAQHRQYAPGDDIRHLDWKIFGRTDKLYLKQYQQETNLDLLLLVDTSGSMSYSSRPATREQPAWRKFDHAASLAAAMAYLALGQQDRVGLMLYSNKIRAATRMSNTHDHWRTIVEVLARTSPEAIPDKTTSRAGSDDESAEKTSAAGTAPEAAVEARSGRGEKVFDELLAKLRRRSIIVLISDLFEDTQVLADAMARIHHRRHDLIILRPLDPAELTFPFRGPSEFVGLEGEGRIPLDPEALRELYLEAFNAHQARLKETARRFRFDYLALDTSESLGPPLSHFLARRGAMIGQGR